MRMHLLCVLQQGMVATIPVACAVGAFATHAALGRSFDLHTMLMVIGCIEQMASAMMVMPNAIIFATMICISFTRFSRVLLLEDTFAPPSGTGGTQAITMTSASFQWHVDARRPSLADVSLTVASARGRRRLCGLWQEHSRCWDFRACSQCEGRGSNGRSLCLRPATPTNPERFRS